MIKLIQGDCLEKMAEIEDGSVDMVLADPPYGTTACKWDSIIPLEPMWEQLKRVIKPNGAIVMTASQPFTTTLIASNMKMFKYCWVWEKENGGNFATANYQPLRVHEDILVWGNFATSYRVSAIKRYNPQLTKGKAYSCVSGSPKNSILHGGKMQKEGGNVTVNKGTRHPRSIIKFNRDKGLHPTQKPVALMEYLIKTYTNEGETVLDFTMGSGTTGVACANLNRDFIGIEKDLDYFNIALTRIEEAVTANACSV